MSDAPLSPVEGIKARSRHLRGTIAEGLRDRTTGALAEDYTQLIKFHGSYQQDDRDLREERRQQKLEPAYSFMIRTRLPGGAATPQQWLALDAITRAFGNGTLKLTTQFAPAAKSACCAACRASRAASTSSKAAAPPAITGKSGAKYMLSLPCRPQFDKPHQSRCRRDSGSPPRAGR